MSFNVKGNIHMYSILRVASFKLIKINFFPSIKKLRDSSSIKLSSHYKNNEYISHSTYRCCTNFLRLQLINSKLFRICVFFSNFWATILLLDRLGFKQYLLRIWRESTSRKQHPFSRNPFYSQSGNSLVAPTRSDGRKLRFLKRNKIEIWSDEYRKRLIIFQCIWCRI